MAAGTGEARAVSAAPPFDMSIRVPGSKSLTNRALVLAAMASGTTDLPMALRSDDTDGLSSALRALGAMVVERGAGSPLPGGADAAPGLRVRGVGGAFPAGGDAMLNLGDGGTPTRFAMALAAFAGRRVTIDGSARMRERPVADGVDLLRALGARVEWAGAAGRLPLTVDGRGGPPAGGSVRVGPLASSQFVSALLLVAPWMRDGLELTFDVPPVSRSYIDLTVDELRRWGAAVSEDVDPAGNLRAVRVSPGPIVGGAGRAVEPDASSAVYWAAAASMVPGSSVVLEGLSVQSRQPDLAAIRALAAQGAALSDGAGLRVTCRRAAGDRAPPLDGLDASLERCPDGALMLVAAAAVSARPSRFTGLGTLRVKESDRIAAMADGLARIGARARITESSIEVDPLPPGTRVNATIDPRGDHRVAMSFAVLGLRTGGLRIADPGCVSKSYPGFWDALARLEQSSR